MATDDGETALQPWTKFSLSSQDSSELFPAYKNSTEWIATDPNIDSFQPQQHNPFASDSNGDISPQSEDIVSNSERTSLFSSQQSPHIDDTHKHSSKALLERSTNTLPKQQSYINKNQDNPDPMDTKPNASTILKQRLSQRQTLALKSKLLKENRPIDDASILQYLEENPNLFKPDNTQKRTNSDVNKPQSNESMVTSKPKQVKRGAPKKEKKVAPKLSLSDVGNAKSMPTVASPKKRMSERERLAQRSREIALEKQQKRDAMRSYGGNDMSGKSKKKKKKKAKNDASTVEFMHMEMSLSVNSS